MNNKCPKCGKKVSLSYIERLKPFITKGYAFKCNSCETSLIIDFWHPKVNLFRVLFVIGVVLIIIGLPRLGATNLLTYAVAAIYVLVSWVILNSVRKIRYADNRLYEQEKQNQVT